VHAAVEVRNLLDVRTSSVTLPVGQRTRLPFPIADFIGFPLPGRTVFATVRVDIDWGHSPQKEHS
jgi:hypothetical protein